MLDLLKEFKQHREQALREAEAALEQIRHRLSEDPEAWAARLAADLAQHKD